MVEQNGHVTVNERIPSQRFHRFVDEKMKDWINDNEMLDNTEYEVAFFDEDSLGEVSCLIVLQSGDRMWRAWESADNPRAALKRSIESLSIEEDEDIVGVNPTTH